MTKTRVTLDLDSEIDARLRMLAERRGQEKSGVVTDALALLDLFETKELDISKKMCVGCVLSSRAAKASRSMM